MQGQAEAGLVNGSSLNVLTNCFWQYDPAGLSPNLEMIQNQRPDEEEMDG
jgi:hypothetical protein